jgi:L-amino acid N-acyltransferase YncA
VIDSPARACSVEGGLRNDAGDDDLLRPEAAGRGTGSLLYETLFDALRDEDIHGFIAGITLRTTPHAGCTSDSDSRAPA